MEILIKVGFNKIRFDGRQCILQKLQNNRNIIIKLYYIVIFFKAFKGEDTVDSLKL